MISLLDIEVSVWRTLSDDSELCCIVQYIHSTNAVSGNTMATTKTTTLTFRIEPGLKEAVRTAAELEHRSIANMIEMMIRDYCGKAGVPIQEPAKPLESSPKRKAGKKL
jgi:hypothetical protein